MNLTAQFEQSSFDDSRNVLPKGVRSREESKQAKSHETSREAIGRRNENQRLQGSKATAVVQRMTRSRMKSVSSQGSGSSSSSSSDEESSSGNALDFMKSNLSKENRGVKTGAKVMNQQPYPVNKNAPVNPGALNKVIPR